MTSDGPFGTAPEISVSLSDSVLLLVSSIGFVILATTIYSIIITRLKTAQEIEDDKEEIDYDEKLASADVSTLNRAQRRARARHIMKQQRRIAPAPAHANGEENGPDDGDVEDEQIEYQQPRPLSRKERQKAAKAAEKEERRLFEADRRRQQIANQEEAQRNKKQRERVLAEQTNEDRRKRLELKNSRELEYYRRWSTFLSSDDGSKMMSVKEWIDMLEENRVFRADVFALEFSISTGKVVNRIRQLLKSGRVTGFLESDIRFIYVTQREMFALAKFVKEQKEVSLIQFLCATSRTLQPKR